MNKTFRTIALIAVLCTMAVAWIYLWLDEKRPI